MIPDNVRYFVIDTETTSVEPTATACEVGFIEIDKDFNILQEQSSIVDPGQMISPGASGIHGIVNKDCESYPTMWEWFHESDPSCYGKVLDGPVVVIGHRVSFDVRFFGPFIPNLIQEICTLRYARKLYPHADDHKLQTLKYSLGLPKGGSAHRVMSDVMDSYHLCRHICDRTGMTLPQLADASKSPMEVLNMSFGKYKGEKFSNIPKHYLRWALENMKDLDSDLQYTIRKVLG